MQGGAFPLATVAVVGHFSGMDHADEHPLRYALVDELHARPSPRLMAPFTAVYLAFKEPRDAANRDRNRDTEHLAKFLARHDAPAPEVKAGHYRTKLGRHELRWESHTEFVTYAAFAPGVPARAFDPAEGDVFPDDWQHDAPGKRIAAVMVQVEVLPENPEDIMPKINQWFERDSTAAVWVVDQSAVVAGDFRIDDAGWMRFAVFVRPDVGPGRTGRIVQRLCELETYRAMSMLGLRRVRELSAQLNALEPKLNEIVAEMGSSTIGAETTLQSLLSVSAGLEAAATQHAFRFGATGAYESIVMDRIATLRETRFFGRQMLTEFMVRRYLPAMRTVKSAEKRLTAMLERSERAGELLRTRVDVERSQQNQSLMQRMDKRADLQLRLQHTVEGLSVFAISYYAVGLLSYALGPVAHELAIEKTLMIAVLTPVVVFLVWLSMNRIKARIHREGGGH